MENPYPVKHYHIIFTLPEDLNAICLTDRKWFYNHLFTTVWVVLRSFGYSHYGVENKDQVVFCEPSPGKPQHVVGYLGQYTHRMAISNHRILEVNDRKVRFLFTDYRDKANVKPARLNGEEFLRWFCLHILPAGFIKIRHYGIYSTRFRSTILKDPDKITIKPQETTTECIKRLWGFDIHQCSHCRKGRLIEVTVLSRIRSLTFNVGAGSKTKSC